MMEKKWEKWTCPRCKNVVSGYPATSRTDNTTHICSACGTAEALENFANRHNPPKKKFSDKGWE